MPCRPPSTTSTRAGTRTRGGSWLVIAHRRVHRRWCPTPHPIPDRGKAGPSARGAAAGERKALARPLRGTGRCRTTQHFPFPTCSPSSEAHTSELQSLMRISYAVFCLKKHLHHPHHPYHRPRRLAYALRKLKPHLLIHL